MQEVVLVAGAHVPDPLPKSQHYLQCVVESLEEREFKVILRVAKHPDDDLVFMSNAKHFSPSAGGFSRVITELVRMNAGNIH
tara:strand:+ start:220 stop:465 length:246 start_codon:yes stop_codon:yes gene_type:complete